jgi:membrane protein implicated in regulation of membrane protease activity
VSVSPDEAEYSAQPAPPAAEEIHLPGPTILPLMAAIAITLIVVGTTIDWIFSAVGALALILIVIRWVRDTRRDVAALPEDHH